VPHSSRSTWRDEWVRHESNAHPKRFFYDDLVRRSAYVFAPLLASAALALPVTYRAVAQQPSTPTAAQSTPSGTTREGFGASFREHPLMWLFGGVWVAFLFGAGG
jgi:hypothetical protein